MSASVLKVLGLVTLLGCNGVIGDAPVDITSGQGPHGEPGPGDLGFVGCVDGLCVGESRLARLTRPEYVSSIRAAFGDEVADSIRPDFLPPDDSAGPFASNGFLNIDEDGVNAFAVAAETIAPLVARLDLVDCETNDFTCVAEILRAAAPSLYRRPVEDSEVAAFEAVYEAGTEGASHLDGVELVITALLQTPQFLYRIELGVPAEEEGVRRLTGMEVAARLSLFLWNAPPDQELLSAAASGELDDADGLMLRARRMLDNPRADASVRNFHRQWLGINEVTSHLINADEHPEFQGLRFDMVEETEAFVVRVFRSDAPRIDTLLTAPWTVATESLAEFYGAQPPSPDGTVMLNSAERVGLLMHASVLTANTHDRSTAAVLRGKFVRERLLCQHLPPPPPVDAVVTPDPDLSPRQRLEEKTAPSGCTNCHALMNPLGFAFGHFDVIGGYQETDDGHAIDASGDATNSDIEGSFDGAIQLAHSLAESGQVRRCVARQWLRYAIGRYEVPQDEGSFEAAYERFEEADYALPELLVGIVGSDAFRYRRPHVR